MKKQIITYFKLSLTVVVLLISYFTANAQKLPKTQKIGVRAPVDIKIDGKTTEWNDQFQAYNPVSRVFYTVSNDDNNLYLTLSTDGKFSTDKVILGGVTFTISPLVEGNSKSKNEKYVSVTYPTLSDTKKTERIMDISHSAQLYINDTTKKNKIDSIRSIVNERMEILFKEITVTGIKAIEDPLISIYNTTGIRLVARVNKQMRYIYELEIPLKYLGGAIDNNQRFKYNIKLNGTPEIASNGIKAVQFPDPIAVLPPDGIYLKYPTDFGGEYTLAKK